MAERLVEFLVTDNVTGLTLSVSKTVQLEPFPVVATLVATADGETAVDWACSVNRKGTLYVRVYADGSTPTTPSIKAGTGALAGGSISVTSTGATRHLGSHIRYGHGRQKLLMREPEKLLISSTTKEASNALIEACRT